MINPDRFLKEYVSYWNIEHKELCNKYGLLIATVKMLEKKEEIIEWAFMCEIGGY
jgi:hypothetical protein